MSNEMYYKCYMSTVLKTHSRGFYCKLRETVLIEPTEIRWFSKQLGRRLDLKRGGKKRLKPSYLKGDHQA